MGFGKADVNKLREFLSRFSWEDNLRIKKYRREQLLKEAVFKTQQQIIVL